MFLATVWLANLALERFGFVSVGFGLMAPAGVYFAGASFGLRDAIQEKGGKKLIVALILFGGALSWFITPLFAIASSIAFLFSELADFAVYSPLRQRHWVWAVTASNLVGSIVDSIIFLTIAFGFESLTFSGVAGILLGKIYMIVPALLIVRWVRRK